MHVSNHIFLFTDYLLFIFLSSVYLFSIHLLYLHISALSLLFADFIFHLHIVDLLIVPSLFAELFVRTSPDLTARMFWWTLHTTFHLSIYL